MSAKTSEIFEFNKMMAIYLCSILIGSLWMISYLIHPKSLRHVPAMLFVLLAFLATQIASTYFSIDRHTSIYGYYGRWNGGLLSIIAYIVIFFVFVQVGTKQFLKRILQISLLTSAVVMIWGFLAKFGFDFSCLIFTGHLTNACWTDQFQPAIRMFSTIGQPNWLGAYICIHIFIGLYFLMKELEFKDFKTFPGFRSINAYVYIMYTILAVAALYLTGSRTAWLACASAIGAGIFILVVRLLRMPMRGLFVFVVALAVFISAISFTPGLLKIDSSSTNTVVTDSFDIRKIVWKGAVDLGLKYPYVGSGVETFAYSYYFTRPDEHNRTSEWDFIYNKAHNEYLNYFATTGFVGLIGYLAIIIMTCTMYILILKKQLKRPVSQFVQNGALFFFLAYLTILITNFSGFSTSNIQFFFYLIPAFLIVDAGWNDQSDVAEKQEKIPLFGKVSIAAVVLVMLVLLLQLSRYYRADIHYSTARSLIAANDYSQALINLNDALKLHKEHVYEDKLSNVLAYLAFEYSFDDKKQSAKFIELSKLANLIALGQAPKNMLYWKTQARNYYLYYQVTHDLDDMKHSVHAMEEAVAIAPTDVQTYYSLAVLYVSLADEAKDTATATRYKDKAKSTLVTIFKMKPDYREAQELGGEI